MEAPEKIYLQTCGECPGLVCDTCRFEELGGVSWCEDRIYETDKEYIRKDALLEWAKEQANFAEKYNGRGAMLKAYNSLIDKLNSM